MIDRFEYNEKYVERDNKHFIQASSDNYMEIFDEKLYNPFIEYSRWETRYKIKQYGKNTDDYIALILDEVGLTTRNEHNGAPLDQYAQLYVPFDWFKAACKQVKSYYKDSNGYAGYHNYMKYWARNGEWNWICNREEYKGDLINNGYPDFVEITKTFDVTGYWDSYDGKKHVDDGVGNVYGWYGDWIDETQKKAG